MKRSDFIQILCALHSGIVEFERANEFKEGQIFDEIQEASIALWQHDGDFLVTTGNILIAAHILAVLPGTTWQLQHAACASNAPALALLRKVGKDIFRQRSPFGNGALNGADRL